MFLIEVDNIFPLLCLLNNCSRTYFVCLSIHFSDMDVVILVLLNLTAFFIFSMQNFCTFSVRLRLIALIVNLEMLELFYCFSLRNRLISVGLEPVLKNYVQHRIISIIISPEPGFNLLIVHFYIYGKLFIIRCDK